MMRFDNLRCARACVCIPACSFPLGLAVQGVLFLVLIATVLHILDRQGDFVSRTDFIWKAKLKVEQEEVETMRGINKVGGHAGWMACGLCGVLLAIVMAMINRRQTCHAVAIRYTHREKRTPMRN